MTAVSTSDEASGNLGEADACLEIWREANLFKDKGEKECWSKESTTIAGTVGAALDLVIVHVKWKQIGRTIIGSMLLKAATLTKESCRVSRNSLYNAQIPLLCDNNRIYSYCQLWAGIIPNEQSHWHYYFVKWSFTNDAH